MRGSIRKRYEGSWTLILDLGYQLDLTTGTRKRRQKWLAIKGTKKDAQAHLTEVLRAANRNEFVEPSKLTVGAWLTTWLEIAKGRLRPATVVRYTNVVEALKAAPIGGMALQKVRATDIETHYARAGGSASTLSLHHTVLNRALRKAKRDNLITSNPAPDVENRPRRRRDPEVARENCWSREEARQFLAAAKQAGPQSAALYTLALEAGMRKNELCGLAWKHVDLEGAQVTVERQLTKGGAEPVYGPPKNGRARTITITAETVDLLRAHKRAQAEVKMANRASYHDHGLVFAKEYGELRRRLDKLGDPLQSNNLGERSFARLCTAAQVRRITFHGLRHTSATLLLADGEPVHVVSERLGHRDVSVTLNVYAHVLKNHQRTAAERIGALLHGAG
jgi:integrase